MFCEGKSNKVKVKYLKFFGKKFFTPVAILITKIKKMSKFINNKYTMCNSN